MSELGSGGMGRVFLAERSDGHYRPRAAVKLLLAERRRRAGQLGASADHGREAHPNIARLIDGGTTPLGAPIW